MFDPITVWTALGVIVVAAGGVIGLVLKGYDTRFSTMENKVDSVANQVAEKAHKDEVSRIEARFERDISDLRTEQRSGFDGIKQDLRDMESRFMTFIKQVIEK